MNLKDDTQMFYGIAPLIDGTDIFIDLINPGSSRKLNTWSIITEDHHNIRPLTHTEKIELYSEVHDDVSNSLLAPIKRQWKTGLLQKTIDCLVFDKYRGSAEVYTVIDEDYRRLLRYKYETEYPGIPNELTFIIRKMIRLLGLQNSHDTDTVFYNFPDKLGTYMDKFFEAAPGIKTYHPSKSYPETSMRYNLIHNLSNILSCWSGARIIRHCTGFRLQVKPNILTGLSYMQPLLLDPDFSAIFEDVIKND
jgi:hypothetical protein